MSPTSVLALQAPVPSQEFPILNPNSAGIESSAPTGPAVVVFLSQKCPCSNSHHEKLAALAKRFPKIRFIGVHSNADEGLQLSKEHFAKVALPFPVIEDADQKLADQFKALKTPHAYLVSEAGEILYSGGVDDSHVSSEAKADYLAKVLEAYEAHQPIPFQHTRTLGCVIKRKKDL